MPAARTYLHVASLGPAFFVFRIDGGEETKISSAGLHRSKRAANKAAKVVAALTGETIR